MRKIYLLVLMVIFFCCTKNKVKEKQNTEVSSINIDSTLKYAGDKSVKKEHFRNFELKEIEGAWFDDPDENGLFYIDDSIFYLDSNETYPIWVTTDSLMIDFGFDTTGFRIVERSDTIRLVPLDDLKDKGLFRVK